MQNELTRKIDRKLQKKTDEMSPVKIIKALRTKTNPKDDRANIKAWIKSYKEHTKRVQENNIKLLLKLIPGGDNYIVNRNGRIVKKSPPCVRDCAESEDTESEDTESEDTPIFATYEALVDM